MTISCFLLICIVDKSERARSTGGRIRMNKDLESGIRTYAVYFHSYQESPASFVQLTTETYKGVLQVHM